MNIRQEKGQLIAQIKDDGGSYNVHSTELGWKCDCLEDLHRGVKCKHIFAVEFSFAFREKVREEIHIQPITSLNCKYCSSENVVKKALRDNKCGTSGSEYFGLNDFDLLALFAFLNRRRTSISQASPKRFVIQFSMEWNNFTDSRRFLFHKSARSECSTNRKTEHDRDIT